MKIVIWWHNCFTDIEIFLCFLVFMSCTHSLLVGFHNYIDSNKINIIKIIKMLLSIKKKEGKSICFYSVK